MRSAPVARALAELAGALDLCSPPSAPLAHWRANGMATDGRCPHCGAITAPQHAIAMTTSEDLVAQGRSADHRVVLCGDCGVGRTTPPPRWSATDITPDVADTRLGMMQRELMTRFIASRVARVRSRLVGARPRVAEVGAGACAFANALAAAGCEVLAFEPNAANAVSAGDGVQFIAAPFDEAAVAGAGIADGSLDGVTLWHALEHVPDPEATLALARRLLKPGGLLHVCVPNLDALQADVGGTRWCYADVPHHLTHYSIDGLARAMRRARFGSFVTTWWNAEYEVFGWYQTLLNRLTASHNYFYNRAKKGKYAPAGEHPAWTRLATALGPILLPVALVASWWGAASGKPACAEIGGLAE